MSSLDDGLQRGLKNRHLIMISFGGVVGASIWYGTGYAIAYSGPVGALVCFFIIGVDVYFVMQCLGEMSTLFPIQGAFIELAGRFVDPSLAFSLGWNYFYLWVTNVAGDFNASSIIMGYWTDKVPTYGWILIWFAFYQVTSLLGVVVWGEMEFYFACWKLFCILGGFLCAILLNTGAIGGEYIGFRFWRDPGPIANGIDGFGQCFLLAAVYYCGTEMLALTAAESKSPTRDLPKAIKQTFWRVLIIFMLVDQAKRFFGNLSLTDYRRGLVFFAGIIVPSNSPDLLTAATRSGKSPWTIAFANAGAPQVGNVVNVVMYASNSYKSRFSSDVTTFQDHRSVFLDEFSSLCGIPKSGLSGKSRPRTQVLCEDHQKRHTSKRPYLFKRSRPRFHAQLQGRPRKSI